MIFLNPLLASSQNLRDFNKVLNYSFSKHFELLDSLYVKKNQESYLKYGFVISVDYLFRFTLDTSNTKTRIRGYEEGMFSKKEWRKGVSIFQISKIDIQQNKLEVIIVEAFYKKERFKSRTRVVRFGMKYFYEFNCESEVWEFVRWE